MVETARTRARAERFPLTREALDAVSLEIDRLVADLAAAPSMSAATPDETDERVDAAEDRGSVPLPLDVARAQRRLDALREIREAAWIVDDPSIAAVGRRVTLAGDAADTGADAGAGAAADRQGVAETYSLVLPGDGDPALGWVSLTSPLGLAVCGRRAGEQVAVHAPAGSWTATILAVE